MTHNKALQGTVLDLRARPAPERWRQSPNQEVSRLAVDCSNLNISSLLTPLLAVFFAAAATGGCSRETLPPRIQALQEIVGFELNGPQVRALNGALVSAAAICNQKSIAAGPDYERCMDSTFNDLAPDALAKAPDDQPFGFALRVPRDSSAIGGAGVPMYPASSCTGPVVNGECKGTILHPGPPPLVCHGQVLNGQCIGAAF